MGALRPWPFADLSVRNGCDTIMIMNVSRAKPESEWWYYNGHLSAGERRFGFHFAIFRGRLERIRLSRRIPLGLSISNLWAAHFGLVDLNGGVFRYAQRRSPGTCSKAGSAMASDGEGYRVWLDRWSLEGTPGRHDVKADMKGVRLELELEPVRPRLRHGRESGEFRKTDRHVSCYVSHPRLAAKGWLEMPNGLLKVAGEAWSDHESGPALMGAGPMGWDWFSIQFEGGGELMVYGLRDRHGALGRHACATLVLSGGTVRRYWVDRLFLEPLEWWTSSATGISYVMAWKLKLGGADADLRIQACVRCCEVDARSSTGIIYWDGPALVQGMLMGSSVQGRAYVEQVARNQRDLLGVFDFGNSSIGLRGWLANEYWLRRHGRGVTVADGAG
jgi:predicted secreted hydrolase